MNARSAWHLTILSSDDERLIFHAQCEDRKEVQALATEARHASQALRILVRSPAEAKCTPGIKEPDRRYARDILLQHGTGSGESR